MARFACKYAFWPTSFPVSPTHPYRTSPDSRLKPGRPRCTPENFSHPSRTAVNGVLGRTDTSDRLAPTTHSVAAAADEILCLTSRCALTVWCPWNVNHAAKQTSNVHGNRVRSGTYVSGTSARSTCSEAAGRRYSPSNRHHWKWRYFAQRSAASGGPGGAPGGVGASTLPSPPPKVNDQDDLDGFRRALATQATAEQISQYLSLIQSARLIAGKFEDLRALWGRLDRARNGHGQNLAFQESLDKIRSSNKAFLEPAFPTGKSPR
jgi:hypothetical protein